MADDTVEEARQDVLAVVGTGTDTPDLRVRLDKTLDVLIAAVRAERSIPSGGGEWPQTETLRCTCCNDNFPAAMLVRNGGMCDDCKPKGTP